MSYEWVHWIAWLALQIYSLSIMIQIGKYLEFKIESLDRIYYVEISNTD